MDPKTQNILSQWRSIAAASKRQRLFIMSSRQLNTFIRDYQEAVQWATEREGISHSKTHDLRRTFVQERLEFYLDNGISREQALGMLSGDLGHGRSRMERGLLASYLPFENE